MADDRAPLTVVADDDRHLWTLLVEGGGPGQPVLVGGTLYVSVPGERIAALDAGRGQLRWCSEKVERASLNGMAVAGDVVVVPVRQERGRGAFTALDAATGKERWTRRKSALNRVVAVGDSTFVLWNDDSDRRQALTGIDALTGETLWEDEFERISWVVGRGERVILDARGIRALDARSGEEIWDKGSGRLLVAAGTGEDAAVFLSYCRDPSNALVVQAADTGKKVSEIRFPDKLGMKHSWALPELVDRERALFFDSLGRRIRLFACAGLNRAQSLGSWQLGRWRLSTLHDVVCVGDRVYALSGRRKVYVAEVGGRRGLRRLTLRGPDGRIVRMPRHLTAGPGYLVAHGSDGVAMIQDGRVLWASETLRPSGDPIPLDADRVLLRAPSRNGKGVRLYCAEVRTGRRLRP
ncbi:outer membrane protein assembly factor BamB family protein [Streptomyces prunicolor]